VQHQRAVAAGDVADGPFEIPAVGHFLERVAWRDGAVLRLAAGRTEPPAREPGVQGGVQHPAIDTGLASRDNPGQRHEPHLLVLQVTV
jgi:hypothetical protein